MRRILFVCLGNICRSPTAEGVLRDHAIKAGLDIEIDSAGTGGWHIGEPPYGPMQDACRARGYDLSSLRARQFSSSDFDAFNLIFVMDESNRDDVEAKRPSGNNTPVHLFMEFASHPDYSEVPDPYYTRDFDLTIDLVEYATEKLISKLKS